MTNLRDKDQTVLQQIHSGNNDTQQITEATTLSNREVNYCLTKLEDQGLIQVHKPEGMVERVVNGQKRVFEHPKRAEITEMGENKLKSQPDNDMYENMDRIEMVERIRALESRVSDLEQELELFRQQVLQKLK
jgi:predicted transcriptional regulator